MNNKVHVMNIKDDLAQQKPAMFYVLIFAILVFVTFGFATKVSANATAGDDANIAFADTTDVYTVVDEMPEIIGGLPELYKKIKYPRNAVREGIEGRVFIQFIVDENGNAVDPEIMRDIGGGCGDAAIEAIQQVQFTPGIQNGEAVKVRFSLPVTFRIES